MFIELTSEEGYNYLVNLSLVTSIAAEDDGRACLMSVIIDEQRKDIVRESYLEVKEMVMAVQRK